MSHEIEEVFDLFLQLQAEAELKGLALTFTGEQFLLQKLNGQLLAKYDNLSEIAFAIDAHAWMGQYGNLLAETSAATGLKRRKGAT